jgi:ribosomal protein S12 methylthiotransferase accessory factor YcaO
VAAAKVSALMEAIELWHAENIVRPMVFAAHCDLPESPAAVDVESTSRIEAGFDATPPIEPAPDGYSPALRRPSM